MPRWFKWLFQRRFRLRKLIELAIFSFSLFAFVFFKAPPPSSPPFVLYIILSTGISVAGLGASEVLFLFYFFAFFFFFLTHCCGRSALFEIPFGSRCVLIHSQARIQLSNNYLIIEATVVHEYYYYSISSIFPWNSSGFTCFPSLCCYACVCAFVSICSKKNGRSEAFQTRCTSSLSSLSGNCSR